MNFVIPEIVKLQISNKFSPLGYDKQLRMMQNSDIHNYIIDEICLNQYGEYIFAVVTDPIKSSLYVL